MEVCYLARTGISPESSLSLSVACSWLFVFLYVAGFGPVPISSYSESHKYGKPKTGYGLASLAKQLVSETVTIQNHNK